MEAWATCRHKGDVAKVNCTLLERQKDCRDPEFLMHALFEANQNLHLLLSPKIASRHSPALAVTVVWAEHHKPDKLFAIHSAPSLDPWRGV